LLCTLVLASAAGPLSRTLFSQSLYLIRVRRRAHGVFDAAFTLLPSTEEAPHPTRQPAAFGRALVVNEVVGMDGDAGLAE
jgi:hypothetical protein